MTPFKLPPFLLFLACAPLGAFAEPAALSLAGDWRVQLRPDGVAAPWDDSLAPDTVRIPGSVQAQGLGDPVSVKTQWIGNIVDKSWHEAPEYAPYREPGREKIPFWLQPERHFVGAATFRREFSIPSDFANRRTLLTLERVHIRSRVRVDGREVGSDNSLSTPHRYDLGRLAPGVHTIVVAVDNIPPKNIGVNSHCVSDNTQTNWAGMIGEVKLEGVPDTWMDGLETYPDVAGKRVRVTWRLAGESADAAKIAFTVMTPDGKTFSAEADATAGEAVIPLGDAVATWDEFSPALHRLKAVLKLQNGGEHTRETTFGMVDYRIEGRRLLVNGRPTVMRGTLDCAVNPKTGYPATDVASWKREIAAVKAHGLNHIRFHSWCPPEAAFIAADELGCYLQIEHAWTNPADAGDYLMGEAERVVRAYGNHPSFSIHAYGNEPAGGKAWLENFSAHFRTRDPRRLYTGAAGRDAFANSQVSEPQDSGIRVYPWGAGLGASINKDEPATLADFSRKVRATAVPLISHEAGQWCVYPDFSEIAKYDGFLKAKNFEIFRDFLAAHHMGDQAKDFLNASGRLQTLCYKYEIEKLLRTPEIGGYQLLGLNDFPGQGTALVGAVNPFWETKSYTTPAEYRSFSGPSVPLARLPRFVFKSDETLKARLEIAHHAAEPLSGAAPFWRLEDDAGRAVLSGKLPARDIPLGHSVLGEIAVPLATVASPAHLKLVVGVTGTDIANRWDIRVYPAVTSRPDPGEMVVSADPAEASRRAAEGASVLLMPPAARIADPAGPKVVLGFSTIFWNTAWTRRQPPTTMGILCDPKHPALAGFPTEAHSDYQWWYVLRLAKKPLSLEGQPPELRPVVQIIDDWFTARRLGLVVEARLGKGRVLVCAPDLQNAPAADFVSAQLRASLIDYMKSPRFAPRVTLAPADFAKMFTQPVDAPRP